MLQHQIHLLLSSFEPCQAEKSYGMTLKDHVEEWLHLNPQNGQLQITESGLQMAQKGKTVRHAIC